MQGTIIFQYRYHQEQRAFAWSLYNPSALNEIVTIVFIKSSPHMKGLFISGGIIIAAHLYLGYYVSMDIEDPRVEVFIKKHPTLQVKFENIYTRSSAPKSWPDLNMVEEKMIRDYCKYRLGIETWLDNADELEACKAR